MGARNRKLLTPEDIQRSNAADRSLATHTEAYNDGMARGWESKSVEQQQEEAATGKSRGTPLSVEQAAAQKRRQRLLLSRQHILQQLEAASNPTHRQMLEAALADLDAQLKDFKS